MSEVYNHKVVEKKWQKVWDDEKALLQPEREVMDICPGEYASGNRPE